MFTNLDLSNTEANVCSDLLKSPNNVYICLSIATQILPTLRNCCKISIKYKHTIDVQNITLLRISDYVFGI